MSAICQNTSLNSPLQNIILYEAFESVKDFIARGKKGRLRCRNGRVSSSAYDLLALNEFITLPELPSSFTQNLSSYYRDIPFEMISPHVLAEWTEVLSRGSILASSKIAVLSHNQLPFQQIKEQIDTLSHHENYHELMQIFYWKWILEQLVVATARPKSVTQKYGSALNPHVLLNNPGHRNPLFSYTLGNNIYLIASATFLYIESYNSHLTWLVSREHLLQFADTATQLYLTLLTSMFGQVCQDHSIPTPQLLLDIWGWGDQLLTRFGNNGYKSLKFWEPLLTSYLLGFIQIPM